MTSIENVIYGETFFPVRFRGFKSGQSCEIVRRVVRDRHDPSIFPSMVLNDRSSLQVAADGEARVNPDNIRPVITFR